MPHSSIKRVFGDWWHDRISDKMQDSAHFDLVLQELAGCRKVLVDACSCLYMSKAGFLADLAACVELLTVPQVVDELGEPPAGVGVLASAARGVPGRSADESLLLAAKHEGIPLVSEDRKLLLKLRARGCTFYNSLMMLHLLLLRRRIGRAEHARFRERLLGVARYGEVVLEYGDAFEQFIVSSADWDDR